MRFSVSAGLFFLALQPALAAPPALDNSRVTAWDVPLSKGEAGPQTPADLESVTLFLEGGTVRTQNGDGTSSVAERHFGDAVFNPRGSRKIDTALTDGVHEVLVALKDKADKAPDVGPAGVPISFPRAGAQKMLEGEKFIVWRFSWPPNQAVPMHHHDKDTVMVFRYDGRLRSTSLEGDVRDLPFKRGQVNFSKAGTTHTETLIDEQQSAVDLELK